MEYTENPIQFSLRYAVHYALHYVEWDGDR